MYNNKAAVEVERGRRRMLIAAGTTLSGSKRRCGKEERTTSIIKRNKRLAVSIFPTSKNFMGLACLLA